MKYTVVREHSEDDAVYLVSVPAFPEIHTHRETAEEAIANDRGAIELAVEMYQKVGKGAASGPGSGGSSPIVADA